MGSTPRKRRWTRCQCGRPTSAEDGTCMDCNGKKQGRLCTKCHLHRVPMQGPLYCYWCKHIHEYNLSSYTVARTTDEFKQVASLIRQVPGLTKILRYGRFPLELIGQKVRIYHGKRATSGLSYNDLAEGLFMLGARIYRQDGRIVNGTLDRATMTMNRHAMAELPAY